MSKENKNGKRLWNGFWLSEEVYEQVKDTYFVPGPTHYELTIQNSQFNIINNCITLLNSKLSHESFIPEMSSIELCEMVNYFYGLDIVKKFYDEDEVEIESNKEVLKGLKRKDVQTEVFDILFVTIKLLSEQEKLKWH
jgi:hypothetical protein